MNFLHRPNYMGKPERLNKRFIGHRVLAVKFQGEKSRS